MIEIKRYFWQVIIDVQHFYINVKENIKLRSRLMGATILVIR